MERHDHTGHDHDHEHGATHEHGHAHGIATQGINTRMAIAVALKLVERIRFLARL